MRNYYCPGCGRDESTRIIESTEPDPAGEYKDVCTCDHCATLFYVIRHNESKES